MMLQDTRLDQSGRLEEHEAARTRSEREQDQDPLQERLPAQSNPLHEHSIFMLLISGFNKNLPERESRFMM
jgi:hypothetical protein